jgi:5-amino-6-(5-phosphoribosylamino)uracil reductase
VGDDEVDLTAALHALGQRGASVVTCEGGPRLNGDLLVHDLVDEWALTLSPVLVGGEADRSAHGRLTPELRQLELDRLLEGDGLVLGRWLRAGALA